jgi:spermidine synthase
MRHGAHAAAAREARSPEATGDGKIKTMKKKPHAPPAAPPQPSAPSTFRLKLVALLSGACLMALEMAGVRLLEPHFGSTIYVWGSIIGIFLTALSLGYWLGGALADRRPALATLGGVLLAAALFTFLVPPLAGPVCQALSRSTDLDPRLRALLSSIALFAVPCALMGMVSPFVVRLATRSVSGVGSVAGLLYAISTLGSIIGTFLVSFVLTEWLGSRWIVYGVGLVLMLVSGICLIGMRGLRRAGALALSGVSIAAGWYGVSHGEAVARDSVLAPFEDVRRQSGGEGLPGKVLESRESAYHRITVVETQSYTDPRQRARYMVFNNQVQSGIHVSAEGVIPAGPIQTACGYTRWLHAGVLFTQRAPERVLIIGCGGGVGPQSFADDYAGAVQRIDVVDIDPHVLAMARRWFRFPTADGVLRAHVADGRLFVAQSTERWDYIVLDAYTAGSRIPRHLISQEYFAAVKSHLTPGGVVVANVIGALEGDGSRLLQSAVRTMQSVFGPEQVYVLPRSRSGPRATNVFLVGLTGGQRVSAETLRERTQELRGKVLKQPGLDEVAGSQLRSPLEIGEAPLLTDDFCPTDSMTRE